MRKIILSSLLFAAILWLYLYQHLLMQMNQIHNHFIVWVWTHHAWKQVLWGNGIIASLLILIPLLYLTYLGIKRVPLSRPQSGSSAFGLLLFTSFLVGALYLQSNMGGGSGTGGGTGAPTNPAGPVMGFYLTTSCPTSNTGQCIFTFADTQEADACTWAAAAPDVFCYSTLNNLAGAVAANVATYTPKNTGAIPQTVPSSWAIGNSVVVSAFTGADTFFNQTCTLTATTLTSFSCALTHANASSSTFGLVQNTNVGPFVAADVGKSAGGGQTCQAFQNQTVLGANVIAQSTLPTIATFVNSTHITLSANAAGTSTLAMLQPIGACFVWGHPDDANAALLETAYYAAPQCPKVFLAAAYYMLTKPVWTSQPPACVHQPAGVSDSFPNIDNAHFLNIFYSSGYELEGRGAGNTIIYLMQNFPNGGAWNQGINSAAAFVIPVGGRWKDFQMTGGWQGNPTNFVNGGELIYASVASIDNFVCTNFGAFSPAIVTIGMRLDWQVQLYQVANSGCGTFGIATQPLHGQVTAIKLSVENSLLTDVSISQTSGHGFDFACYDCKFFNSQATSFAQSPVVLLSNGGRTFLEHTQVTTGTNAAGTQMFGYKTQNNAGGQLILKDSIIDFSTSATSNIAINQTVAGTVIMEASQATGGSAGQDYQDVAGSKFQDLGGNTYTATPRFSVSGQVNGSSSIGNTLQTTGNFAIAPASSATFSAVSGSSISGQITVTWAGTPSTTETITMTFPSTFPIAPRCTVIDVGGNNPFPTAIDTTNTAPTTTTLTIKNTFAIAPTVGNTNLFVWNCTN